VNKTIQAFLIFLVILVGVFIGFQIKKTSLVDNKVLTMPVIPAIYKDISLHIPKYLCEQQIDHSQEHLTNRKEPTNKNEKIIKYFEDFHANKQGKNNEVYEKNGTVYLNINGQIQTIASHGVKHHAVPMMPKLSASKRFISYTLCNDKNNSCDMIVKEIASKREIVLEGAKELNWHSGMDILLYALSKEDTEHNSIESEVYLYDAQGMHLTQLTQSKEFVEINPIFSEEGDVIYCEEAKSKKLLYFALWAKQRDKHISATKFYKTANDSLSIEEIKKRSNLFMPIDKDERFSEKNMSYWIEFELKKDTASGQYSTTTYPFLFNQNSFTQKQLTLKNPIEIMVYPYDKNYIFNFSYEAGVDATHYYFRLKSYVLKSPFSQGILKIEPRKKQSYEPIYPQRYTFSKNQLIYKLLSAIVIGMILMSALYTAIMYVSRRQKEFIYYTLMQVSMALLLLTSFRGLFFSQNYLGELSLVVAFFATLFTKSFLKTRQYLPKMDMLLNAYLVLIIADMVWIFEPLLMHYGLYEFFGMLYLIIAIIRIKDGFKPAWFFLFGWIGLLLAIFVQDYFHFPPFTMFVGVFVEAVMLAWGLVYVSGFGVKSK